MIRCTSLIVTLLLLSSGSTLVAGTPFLEEFLDDDLLDGQPVYWHHVQPVEAAVAEETKLPEAAAAAVETTN